MGMLKVAGDYDYVLGVNFLNQHLAYYSIRGRRKRDYPSSCSYHLPGYELYKSFNDYYARLSLALAQGQAVSRVLVLHPISSAWALYTPRDTKRVKMLDQEFNELCRCLQLIQRDYDFGDEMLMEKHARIERGEWVVGQSRYQVVVVPASENWSRNTLRLMKDYTQQGGVLITVGTRALHVNGCPSDELGQFWDLPSIQRIEVLKEKALERAMRAVPRDIQVTDAASRRIKDLIYQHRNIGDRELYFLTFGKMKKDCRVFVSLEGEGAVELWDAIHGTISELPAQITNGRTLFELNVLARSSHLVFLDRGRKPAVGAQAISVEPARKRLEDPWQVSRIAPNVLVIEQCRVRFGDSPWSEPIGINGGGGTVMLPNAHDLLEMAFEKQYTWPTWPIHLRFEYRAKLPEGVNADIRLVVENDSALIEFHSNGKPVQVSASDWWLDRQFRTVDLKGTVVNGLNKIECLVKWVNPIMPKTLKFTPDGVELENVYLTGNFNVVCKGASTGIIPEASLPADPSADLTKHGLPFYAGVIRYEQEWSVADVKAGRKYVLKFPRPNGEGIRLSVNGHFVEHLWCEPFEADCTAFIRPGANRIQADLFSTLGNLMGLTHHKAPWSDPAHAVAQYILRPLGLGGVPEMTMK
ncbi:MAG: hypothetical protein KKD33_07180 [Verrucomicrobia bacterium]|nr:hypothetical protein [Verrucomicrobiota bacterium]